MNKSVKNKKQYTIIMILFSIISLIFISTIAYSAFSSTMHITGIAHARVEANARITDFRLSSTNNATSSYEEFGKNHIVSNIDLKSSTSSITYYIEITNYGSTDVGILNITGLPNGVNYSIKDYKLHDKICNDSGKCNSFITKTYELTLTSTSTSSYSGNIKMNFDFRTYHKVTYTDITNNNYPLEVIDGGNLNITFKEDLKRVQILSNNKELAFYKQITNNQIVTLNNITNDVEVKIKEQAARLSSGDLNTIGSEVCIGSECFYIISNDGSTVKMLSKYNLYVGGVYTNEWTAYGDEATGLQNKTMKGYVANETNRNGVTKFSNTNYWSDSASSYPTYVYNSNSILYDYLENYKNKLNTLGQTINEIRLISYEEIKQLGCTNTCTSAPDWIYGNTYWTGSAFSENDIWYIGSSGNFDGGAYNNGDLRGLRPVIELDADEIFVPVAKKVSGNLGEIGSEVCIGEECFYTISSTTDTITMLAKYNLYVGGVNNYGTWTAYGEEATGMQDSTMAGNLSANYIGNGTTPFSSETKKGNNYSDYNGSIIEGYINNYKMELEKIGVKIKEARSITKDELTNSNTFACTEDSACSNKYPWIYSTIYWTQTPYSSTHIWVVNSNNWFNKNGYENKCNGVRPVITISKQDIINT